MTNLPTMTSLSDAKARLSELVRAARLRGEETIITVDGEPAARVVPLPGHPRRLVQAELATFRALLRAILEADRSGDAFDAVELIRDGRR